MRKNPITLVQIAVFIFGLMTAPVMADWIPADGHKMHFPQLPDVNGWDVAATWNPATPPPLVIADDWTCSESGWVKDIHFWGSWRNDMIGGIESFILSIHANDPGPPFSHPVNPPLWEAYITDYDTLRFVVPDGSFEGWYNPATGYWEHPDHLYYYQYNIFLPESLWFWQDAGTTYWLNISANVFDPVNTAWGWKTSIEQYMDAAVWADPAYAWTPLYDPRFPTDQLDMAFVITGDTIGPDIWDCDLNPPPDKNPGYWETESNDDCTIANYAQCEYAYCGDIDPTGDQDWWEIVLPQDTCYCLHVRVFADDTPGQYAFGGGLDPFLTIYDSDCTTILFTNDDNNGTFPDAEGSDAQYDCHDTGNCYPPGTVLYIHISSSPTGIGDIGPYLLVINCYPCQCPEDTWYWKPDTTYALTGMPDFPSQIPCHSGPTAVTNCLWWYGAMDYYQFIGPWELKDELFAYFGSDTIWDPWGGTDVHEMELGLLAFFTDVDPYWPFVETTYQAPDFWLMAESLLVCQDIILLIGNWWQDGEGMWWRDGGRYVTMAGVDTANMMVALSDPETDNAEAGFPGRVRPPHAGHLPTDSTHWHPVTPLSYDYPVSHDAYPVILDSPSPGGTWWLPGFPRGFSPSHANCPPEFMELTRANPNPELYPYHAEVEYSVMICPGEPEQPIDTCSYYKPPYPDYAPAGMPDFDQKQNAWNIPGPPPQWTHCGPVALANCFWWFDSKFETNTIPPPAVIDNYSLVTPYGQWDDHDPSNVLPFVDSLALYCNTNGGGNTGTFILDLEIGAISWVEQAGLGTNYNFDLYFVGFNPTMPPNCDFEFIRSEVLRSQDVILLLGFWQEIGGGYCERIGGHYVTIAGTCVEPFDSCICISDPFFDHNEGGPPPPHAANIHNDAQYVSGPHGTIHHDYYDVVPAVCLWPMPPTFVVELLGYPVNAGNAMEFYGQNPSDPSVDPVPPTGMPIHTVIEYAFVICPEDVIDPDIGVQPGTLGYDQCIELVQVYPDQFIICNNGGGTLTVNNITCDISFVSFPDFTPTVNLAAGQCDTFDIQINTTGVPPGTYTGYCYIFSNDPDSPMVNKPHLRIDVLEPDIAVSPDSLYHSQVQNSIVTYYSDFSIINNGQCPLNYAATSPAWATLLGVTGSIPPAGSDLIDVQINTTGMAPGIHIDSIAISSDDPDTPVLYRPKIVLEVTAEPVDSLYWKDFNGEEPDGYMPDFDQHQNQWSAYCGPVSIANSLWWFQGKYPGREVVPNEFYDAIPPDPVGFIDSLAALMKTNVGGAGTHVDSMQAGIDRYLALMGLEDLLYEHTLYMPTFDTVEYEVERCQDVTLLIGFWQIEGIEGEMIYWRRAGGHYVTVAGINSQDLLIGFSDPAFDAFEEGWTPGILRGTNHVHPEGHNDGVSASHDIYDVNVEMVCSPGGLWELDHPLWRAPGIIDIFGEHNGGMFYVGPVPWPCPIPPEIGAIYPEIEAAVIVSPLAEPTEFDYLPGDANMWNGTWPPAVLGADATYLINYFRAYTTSVPCFMHNPLAPIPPGPYFWASADANGDCKIIGADATKVINYLRGIGTIEWCPEYPPKYPPIPSTAPPGWPNCQTPPPAFLDEDVIIVPVTPEK